MSYIYGFTAIDGNSGEDITFSIHFNYFWQKRHESEMTRNFCKTLIRFERIRRERFFLK